MTIIESEKDVHYGESSQAKLQDTSRRALGAKIAACNAGY
ncbi:putative multi-domain containing protein, partial [Aduncisulcus paluster]